MSEKMISINNIIYITTFLFQFKEYARINDAEKAETMHKYYTYSIRNILEKGGSVEGVYGLSINAYWDVSEENVEEKLASSLLYANDLLRLWVGGLGMEGSGLFFVGDLTGAVRFSELGLEGLNVHNGVGVTFCQNEATKLENFKKGSFLASKRYVEYLSKYRTIDKLGIDVDMKDNYIIFK